MSVEPTTVPSTPHADQSWPREWNAVEHAGETLGECERTEVLSE